MNLRYYGHSAVQLELGGHSVLIDPFISDNPLTDAELSSFAPEYIILTHAHGDHVGDTEALARKHKTVIISSAEIASYYSKKGLKGHGMNIGGSYRLPFGSVTFTPAWHSSSFPDGTYGGMPMGVIVEAEGKRIYHAGDTALFGDMELIGRRGLDLALLPIGDNFTMGPEDAAEAAKLLGARRVIPIHYNTFEVIRQDPQAFKGLLEQQTDGECVILSAGEVHRLA